MKQLSGNKLIVIYLLCAALTISGVFMMKTVSGLIMILAGIILQLIIAVIIDRKNVFRRE